MKKIIICVLCVAVLAAFSIPRAWADIDAGFDQVEKSLVKEKPVISLSFDAPSSEPSKKQGSSWWKWGLGILVVGLLGLAAGGRGGGSTGGNGGSSDGSVNVGW